MVLRTGSIAAVASLFAIGGCTVDRSQNDLRLPDSLPQAQEPEGGGPPELWVAHEDLRIGSVGDPGTALTAVGDVVLGPDGTLYVRQFEEALIRVFDARGMPSRSIGGRGDGPEEFRSLRHIGLLGDTLYAIDHTLRKIAFFDLDGTFLGSLPSLYEGEFGRFINTPPIAMLADGTQLIRPVSWPRVTSIRELPTLRVARDGVVMDTLEATPIWWTVWK